MQKSVNGNISKSKVSAIKLKFEAQPGTTRSILFGGLGATYNDCLRFIGKRVVDWLLVLTELFSLGVTAESLRANIGSKSVISHRGPVNTKFQVEGSSPTNHSFSPETRLNYLSYGVKIWTFLPFCHNARIWQMDRQTEFSSLDRVCIPCSTVSK